MSTVVPAPILTVLRWETPMGEALWAQLNAHGTDPHADETSDDDERDAHHHLILGPALPDDDDRRAAQVEVVRKGIDAKAKWVLSIYMAPESPPPEEIREANRRCGGQAGLRALLKDAAGTDPLGVEFTARLVLPGDAWQCSLLTVRSGELDDLVQPLGGRALREQVGYRLEDGISGLREVSIEYDHVNRLFHLVLRAHMAWEVSDARWLAEDVALARLVVGKLFSNLEAR